MDNEYEPITINPDTGITFKALKYQKSNTSNEYVFTSPSQQHAVWDKSGLVTATCWGTEIRQKHTLESFAEHSCGIWSAWEDRYARTYRKEILVASALFIGQNYGFAVYDNVKTCRSEQYQIVAAVDDGGSISATIGGKYFGVPVVTLQVARLLVDVQLSKMAYVYEFEYELQYSTPYDFQRFLKTIQLGG